MYKCVSCVHCLVSLESTSRSTAVVDKGRGYYCCIFAFFSMMKTVRILPGAVTPLIGGAEQVYHDVGTDVNSQRRMMWQKSKGESQRNSADLGSTPTLSYLN